jgi:hypothetical protein
MAAVVAITAAASVPRTAGARSGDQGISVPPPFLPSRDGTPQISCAGGEEGYQTNVTVGSERGTWAEESE